jgi:hypothetical protein
MGGFQTRPSKRATSHRPQRARTKTSIFYDRVTAEQRVSEPVDGGQQAWSLSRTSRRVDPNENEARHRLCLPKNQVTEILVFRQQHTIFPTRPIHDFRIGCTGSDFGHVNHVMSEFAQERSQMRVDTLIY